MLHGLIVRGAGEAGMSQAGAGRSCDDGFEADVQRIRRRPV